MLPTEGRPPASADSAQRKYLIDKLSDIRKSCEWLVTLGAANILANLLKGGSIQHWLRRPTLFVVALQLGLALVGATAWLAQDLNPGDIQTRLKRTLRWRYGIRNVSLLLLVVAFLMLLVQIW